MTQPREDPAAKDEWMMVWFRPGRLLIVAAIFHLAVTVSVYALGRYGVLPGTFDSNGIAVSFASDGVKLRMEAVNLSDLLLQGRIGEWLNANSPFHIKLYSICFVFLRPLFGPTILSAEPLNALCYLAMLVLIFNLGKEIFSRRVGLIAAATVALWPSLLLHTTQLLRDPLFLVGMLAFILVNLRFLSRSLSWPSALLTGLSGGLIALFVWYARDSMGELVVATVVLAGAMVIARQWREKHLQAAGLVGVVTLIVISVGVTLLVPEFRRPGVTQGAIETVGPDGIKSGARGRWEATSTYPWLRFATHVGKTRHRFVIQSRGASSNIDDNVELTSIPVLIRYLPRAALIGFLAPFPNMWFATRTQLGSPARLLSGLETTAMYGIEGLAIVGLWRGRRSFSVWFLALAAAIGIISLGLVVVNVGTLYRLRYVFLIMVIILGAGGAVRAFEWCKKWRSDRSALAADV